MHTFRPLMLLLPVLLACPPLLWSKTVTVSAGDANDGIGQLASGDTLIVHNGTHSGRLDCERIPNGSNAETGRTMVKAETPRGVVIAVSGGHACDFGGQSNITLDGFVFDGSNAVSSGELHFEGTNTNITVQNGEIRNNDSDAVSPAGSKDFVTTTTIGVGGDSTNVVIRNMYIHDVGMNCAGGQCCNECYGYGIYLAGTGFILEGNEFARTTGWVVHGYPNAEGGNPNILRNNYFHDSGGPVLLCRGASQAYNNVLVNLGHTGLQHGNGIHLSGACKGGVSSGSVVYHNTIVGSRDDCINLGSASNATVRNNICWHNDTDGVTGGAEGNTVDHNLLGQDPQFVNASGGDYHLKPGSPARDAGVEVHLGLAVVGSAPDLGACEDANPCPPSGGTPTRPTGSTGPTGSTDPTGVAPKDLRVLTRPAARVE